MALDPPRGIHVVARAGHPDFLDLPWQVPLERWDDPRIARMAHGISRHVVRFLRIDERVYAVKETDPASAEREYRQLLRLREEHLPVVEAVGFVTGAADGAGALVTRYLDYSLPYWYLIGREAGPHLTHRLVDAGAVLLVRLHLAGVFWGDCSLSNVLFRRDAGALMAYLVDAETAEVHSDLGDRMRERDLDIAWENVAGGILDLQSAERVPPEIDAAEIADALRDRYTVLWDEITGAEEIGPGERWRIDDRIRRLNELGFDVEELVFESVAEGGRLRLRPSVVEEGHHARELARRTGLEVQENQARRLLADITAFQAREQERTGAPLPDAVAAARWLEEVFEPTVAAVPQELQGRLEPAELFHELLEHRWVLSERARRDVGDDVALSNYLEHQLAGRPPERAIIEEDRRSST